jgi:hypothetical protein
LLGIIIEHVRRVLVHIDVFALSSVRLVVDFRDDVLHSRIVRRCGSFSLLTVILADFHRRFLLLLLLLILLFFNPRTLRSSQTDIAASFLQPQLVRPFLLLGSGSYPDTGRPHILHTRPIPHRHRSFGFEFLVVRRRHYHGSQWYVQTIFLANPQLWCWCWYIDIWINKMPEGAINNNVPDRFTLEPFVNTEETHPKTHRCDLTVLVEPLPCSKSDSDRRS